MHDFVIREIKNSDMLFELKAIGFDSNYAQFATDKFYYKNIKIYNLKVAQANILKQTALSVGADCATHRDVIMGKKEFSDCILAGSNSQILKIAEKLKHQPFSLKNLGFELENLCKKDFNKYSSKSKIMGVLNLTPNSFSDGGLYDDFENAKNHLLTMIDEGADIIDIGAESTKPYSEPVSAEVQLSKILPILDFVKKNNINNVEISIDTRSAEVAHKCIEYGVDYINDVSGLSFDEKMGDVIAQNNVKIIIQHTKGTPENMQDNPVYTDVVEEIYLNLLERVEFALSRGIKFENIIVDPGIGFGKTRKHNFEIIRRIDEFHNIGCPVLLGISRKSLLNMPNASNDEKDMFTLAINTLAVEKNVDIIRVHNVKIHKQLVDMLDV